jgi:hypothetical protein
MWDFTMHWWILPIDMILPLLGRMVLIIQITTMVAKLRGHVYNNTSFKDTVAMAVFISTSIYISLLIHSTQRIPPKPIYIHYKVHDACRKSRNLNPIILQYSCWCSGRSMYGSKLTTSTLYNNLLELCNIKVNIP